MLSLACLGKSGTVGEISGEKPFDPGKSGPSQEPSKISKEAFRLIPYLNIVSIQFFLCEMLLSRDDNLGIRG